MSQPISPFSSVTLASNIIYYYSRYLLPTCMEKEGTYVSTYNLYIPFGVPRFYWQEEEGQLNNEVMRRKCLWQMGGGRRRGWGSIPLPVIEWSANSRRLYWSNYIILSKFSFYAFKCLDEVGSYRKWVSLMGVPLWIIYLGNNDLSRYLINNSLEITYLVAQR